MSIGGVDDIARLISPYHIGHLLSLLSYIPIRQNLLVGTSDQLFSIDSGSSSWLGAMTHEQEIISLAIFVTFVKCRKIATVEQLIEKVFLFGRCAVCVILYFSNVWSYLVWYLIFIAFVCILLRKPRFMGEDDIEFLNLATFDSKIRKPQGPDRKLLWIVIFHADWCEKCVSLEPLFAKLSLRSKDPRRRFAKVDVERYAELGEEFSINMTGFTKQLPSVLMFYKGREMRRLPYFNSKDKVVDSSLSEDVLINYFELDQDVHTVIHRKN